MLQIDNTLISFDIFDKYFVCDLTACHGGCCVEGDSGAPLAPDEPEILDSIYQQVKPYMTIDGVETVERAGKWVVDFEGDKVTPLVKNKHCAYTYQQNGITFCAIEKAFIDGKIDFRKPVSCHLFPIRIAKYDGFEAVNYERNKLCLAARIKGERLGVPLYVFLKEPLIRRFGHQWYEQLCIAANEFEKGNLSV